MVKVSFEIDGQTVSPDSMKDALDYAFLKHIQEKIVEYAGSLRCHEHGKLPIVTVKGKDINSLTHEVSGCCNGLIKKVQKNLKQFRLTSPS